MKVEINLSEIPFQVLNSRSQDLGNSHTQSSKLQHKISKFARMNRFDYKNVIVDIFIWTKLWQTLDLYIFVSVIFQQVTLVYIQEHSSQSLFPSIHEHHSYEHNSNFR